MIGGTTQPLRTTNQYLQSLLGYALFAELLLHASLLLLPQSQSISASRLCTAAVPLLAALCGLWRAQNVTLRERLPWRWLSASMALWAIGQAVEAMIGQSAAALNFKADASDFFNLMAAFPLLLAMSNTRRTELIRSVFYLDGILAILAAPLTYVLLYRTSLTAKTGAMASIYLAECILLAVSAVIRMATWSTLEERRRIHLLSNGVWLFLPIHIGMNYASSHWNLHAGTIFDLLWSAPFVYGGWQCLHLSMSEVEKAPRKEPSRIRLLIESLCPQLVMVAVFALATSISIQHPVLALSSVFVLLLVQGLHAGVVQMNYVSVQGLLLKREQELQCANSVLERLSMLDPLTGIANRRRFDLSFDEAWQRGLRNRRSLALIIIDLDFFKGVNDLHGHTYGDECLISVARVLAQQAMRPDDLLARYGGDEFVLLLPETDAGGAERVAERMHNAVRLLAAENRASPFGGLLTVTIGIGVGAEEIGADPIALIDAADQALYHAKQIGRSTTCIQELDRSAPIADLTRIASL